MTLPGNLAQCYFDCGKGPEPEEQVQRLEALVGVGLPSDYRGFLLTLGGGYLDAWAECTEPTPFGEHGVTTLHSVHEVIDLLDSRITPRNMICVGYGHFGATTCLSIAGLDHGHVFSLETEMRRDWDDETLARYPNLDPKVREFYRLWNSGELGEKPWGYDHCYHVADSFEEFLAKIHPTHR
jgi:hypothetical protein